MHARVGGNELKPSFHCKHRNMGVSIKLRLLPSKSTQTFLIELAEHPALVGVHYNVQFLKVLPIFLQLVGQHQPQSHGPLKCTRCMRPRAASKTTTNPDQKIQDSTMFCKCNYLQHVTVARRTFRSLQCTPMLVEKSARVHHTHTQHLVS